MVRLFDADQLHDATGNIPVLNVQVAISIPIRTMRATEDAFDPLRLRYIEIHTRFGIHIVTQYRNDGVAFVEDHESAMQVRDRYVITLDGR